MKKIILLALLLCSIGIYEVSKPKEAFCAWCPTYPCYVACGSCACMSSGAGVSGMCVSFNRVPEFLSHGYVELK